MIKQLSGFLSLDRDYKRDLALVFALGFAVLFYLAVFSFHVDDPSGFSTSVPENIVKNFAGAFGANLASLVVYYFGLVALMLPMPVVSIFHRIRRAKNGEYKGPLAAVGWFIVLFAALATVAKLFPSLSLQDVSVPSAGQLGQLSQKSVDYYFGPVGSFVALAILFLSGATLVAQRSVLFPLIESAKTISQNTKDVFKRQLENLESFEPFKAKPVEQKTEQEVRTTIPLMQLSDEPQMLSNDTPETLPTVMPLVATQPSNPSVEELVESIPPELLEEEVINELLVNEKPIEPVRKPIHYVVPPTSIFKQSDPSRSSGLTQKDFETIAATLTKTFEEFGIQGKVIGYQPGPVVTVYEFQPEAGIKQSRVFSLIDDIALALKVDSILIHPVPGKRALGVQVPNPKRDTVYLGDTVSSDLFHRAASPLTFAMGKSLSGQPVCADLTTMPHLLCAGATGAGKSVAINSLICSIILKASPEDVRMILVDPKMLELSVYEGIPHLLMPVITEPDRASTALRWAANEMERRYKIMQHASVRHISGFNQFWETASNQKKQMIKDVCQDDSIDRLPYILLVIDELADLMLTAPKDVESSIQRLAQKARASGIHMVLATQRPSVDVITGVIKANLPCRISFQVVSKHDSRTILDQMGAEKLLGKGDMLFQRPGVGRLERIQGALVSDEEVLSLVAQLKQTSTAQYDSSIMSWIDDEISRSKGDEGDLDGPMMDDDPKYAEAVQIGKNYGVVSASFLQRHLKIGYNRAARIVEFMESKGLVAKADGSKPRKWLGSV